MTKMHMLLSGEGYVLLDGEHIWIRPGFEGIAYNDGDGSENGLLATLRRAKDVGVFSPELQAACVDWPSTYHLSSERSNLLRPFSGSFKANTRILEIGAGCGAVTRFLGETGAQIIALEGSRRRAAIARERTRDLDNVQVLVERFQDFSLGEEFDVITLIGVLEYASVFSGADSPALDMLRTVRGMLAPGGRLLLAIENRFGLKYLAGVPEDHLGKPMIGVEGRYSACGVRTWGRFELDGLLANAGFTRRDFHVPMPDYKMPVSIICPAGIAAGPSEFDAGALAAQAVRRDLQVGTTTFNLQRAWGGVADNRLLLDLGNSFLVDACDTDDIASANNPLAWHFSTQRAEAFARETCFVRGDDGRMLVRSRALCGDNPSCGEVRMEVAAEDLYYTGPLLVNEFREVLAERGWEIDSLVEATGRFVTHLQQILTRDGFELADDDPEQLIPDHYIDATPFNLVVTPSGRVVYFDREWGVSSPTLGWLVARSVLFTYAGTEVAPMRPVADVFVVNDLVREVVSRLFPAFHPKWLASALEREIKFQSVVKGSDQRERMRNLLQAELPGMVDGARQYAEANRLAHQIDLVSQSLHAGVSHIGDRIGSVLDQQDVVSKSLHAGMSQLSDRVGAVREQQDAISQSLHSILGDLGARLEAAREEANVSSNRFHAAIQEIEGGSHAAHATATVIGQRVECLLDQLDAVSQSLHFASHGLQGGLQNVHADVALVSERTDGTLKQLDAVSQSLHGLAGALAENVQAIALTVGDISQRQANVDRRVEASLQTLTILMARSDRMPIRRFMSWLQRFRRMRNG